MIVALSGTPGTGKTSVADHLSSFYEVRSVSDLAKKMDCILDEEDENGKVLVIDTECLSKKISSFRGKYKDEVLVIEGHLAHLLPSDVIIVLRCNPIKLKERLSKKEWTTEKVLENVEAELLDVILVEALETSNNVYEIDTSDKTIKKVSEIVVEIIEVVKRGKELKNFKPGKIDWIAEVGEKVDEITRA
ncbi:NMP kinase [Archaeoglobales archaeon]|nr:MAG: NMP kinase [Archaeoglobales archaeon]